MVRSVLSCLVAGAAATSVLAQPSISSADVFLLGAAVNTNDELDDYVGSAGDPSAGLVTFMETALISEPLTVDGSHSVAAAGEFEALGDQWTGEGTVIARYADGLDPTLDAPGTGVGGATFVRHSVEFSLAAPTPVRLEAGVTANFFGPSDAFDLDGLAIDLNHADGTDVFAANLTGFATSGTRSLDEQIVLPAGSYNFGATAFASAVETIGVQLISVNYAFTVTFIPAPASIAVLGLAGFAPARRRR